MAELTTKPQTSEDLENYISDLLTSVLAGEESSDLILRDEEGRMIYVDIEDQSLWVISVRRAEVTVGG